MKKFLVYVDKQPSFYLEVSAKTKIKEIKESLKQYKILELRINKKEALPVFNTNEYDNMDISSKYSKIDDNASVFVVSPVPQPSTKTFTGNKDVDRQILYKLDDRDLANTCQVNKYAKSLCDDNFWMNRTLMQFGSVINPEILKKSKNLYKNWKEYYLVLISYLQDPDSFRSTRRRIINVQNREDLTALDNEMFNKYHLLLDALEDKDYENFKLLLQDRFQDVNRFFAEEGHNLEPKMLDILIEITKNSYPLKLLTIMMMNSKLDKKKIPDQLKSLLPYISGEDILAVFVREAEFVYVENIPVFLDMAMSKGITKKQILNSLSDIEVFEYDSDAKFNVKKRKDKVKKYLKGK